MAPTARPDGEAENAIMERLFNAGLDLHAALRLVRDGPTTTLLHEATDLLDSAIRRLRDQAFDRLPRQLPLSPEPARCALPASRPSMPSTARLRIP